VTYYIKITSAVRPELGRDYQNPVRTLRPSDDGGLSYAFVAQWRAIQA